MLETLCTLLVTVWLTPTSNENIHTALFEAYDSTTTQSVRSLIESMGIEWGQVH